MILKNIKKAAMFGLDARIALAIFALVSVISVSVIHSALEESATEKLIYEAKEIEKAISAYEIDTDSELPILTTGIYDLREIKSSAKPGWKNEYLNYRSATGTNAERYLIHGDVGKFLIFRANDRAATDVDDNPFNSCADAAKVCYDWIMFESSSEGSVPDTYMYLLDKLIDNSDGYLTGRIQQFEGTDLLYRLSVREYYP
tara:strand:- start:8124 stop:8726 length:603 start_codon:yes stop_codon:yes gene_type:complete